MVEEAAGVEVGLEQSAEEPTVPMHGGRVQIDLAGIAGAVEKRPGREGPGILVRVDRGAVQRLGVDFDAIVAAGFEVIVGLDIGGNAPIGGVLDVVEDQAAYARREDLARQQQRHGIASGRFQGGAQGLRIDSGRAGVSQGHHHLEIEAGVDRDIHAVLVWPGNRVDVVDKVELGGLVERRCGQRGGEAEEQAAAGGQASVTGVHEFILTRPCANLYLDNPASCNRN